MKIVTIVPQPSSKEKFAFVVTFDSGDRVEMRAGDLHSYAQFQKRVLTSTGKFFRSSCLDYLSVPRERARVWGDHVTAGLALGEGRSPMECPACCRCFVEQPHTGQKPAGQ